jgi:bifunctional DNA-binding transcriptional regulator/antitoxin component of YhaV-PrlF toxin-antitoxin module
MTITVKDKTALRVPPMVQRKAGIKVGDRLEFRVSGGIINIIPKLPSAEDEYTPKQRRIIDARLDKAAEEVKKGHVSPAFETVAEFAAALQADAKKLKGKAKRSARR